MLEGLTPILKIMKWLRGLQYDRLLKFHTIKHAHEDISFCSCNRVVDIEITILENSLSMLEFLKTIYNLSLAIL